MPHITYHLVIHRGRKRILLKFAHDKEWNERIKKVDGARWSQSLLAWHLPDTEENRIQFKIKPASHSLPSPEGTEKIQKFSQWLISKRYSPSTIKFIPKH